MISMDSIHLDAWKHIRSIFSDTEYDLVWAPHTDRDTKKPVLVYCITSKATSKKEAFVIPAGYHELDYFIGFLNTIKLRFEL